MTTPRKPTTPSPVAQAADPWMSVNQAAKALGIHTQTVYSRAASGVLVTQVVAGRTFVHRDSVEALLASSAAA